MQCKFFPDVSEEQQNTIQTLELTKQKIKTGRLRQHHCQDLAYSLINYLCGKQDKFEKKPAQFSGRYFIQHILQEILLNTVSNDNLFLLQIGKDYHSLVLEKVNGEDHVTFIVYQSWYSTFTLDWWLGNDQSRHNSSEEQQLLREKYGKGKELSLEEMKEFILILTEPEDIPFSTNIGIAGTYKSRNYFHDNKLLSNI
jgi:hypothetical protein